MFESRVKFDRKIEISSAIKKAVRFLIECFEPSTGWSDFRTDHSGISTSWITAYVLINGGQALPNSLIQSAIDRLLKQRKNDGCWGYSEKTPSDCDTTIHVALALKHLNLHKPMISDILTKLNIFAVEPGGFSTYEDASVLSKYRDYSPITSYNGWTSPHPCVSALALRLFTQTYPANISVISKLAAYLSSFLSRLNNFPAYWWESDVYTASCLAYCKQTKNSPVRQLELSACLYLKDMLIREKGILKGVVSKSPCPLETSRAVSPLINELSKDILLYSVDYFLETQDITGFWQSSPSLRIPHPNEISPYNKSCCSIGLHCVGSIIQDQNNIYTTASVLNYLVSLTQRDNRLC